MFDEHLFFENKNSLLINFFSIAIFINYKIYFSFKTASKVDNGSSNKITLLSIANALAIATRRFYPPESSVVNLFEYSSILTIFKHSRALFLINSFSLKNFFIIFFLLFLFYLPNQIQHFVKQSYLFFLSFIIGKRSI